MTVLVREPDDAFDVTPEQKEELFAAIAEADRGEVVDGWELLGPLKV